MRTAFWQQVLDGGCRVPPAPPLRELTTDLVAMLGSVDQHVRDDLGSGVLSTWVAGGVYDDVLPGLGDGLAAALGIGLGQDAGDAVLRRAGSAVALAAVVRRDTKAHLLHPDQVLGWADRAMSWLVAERDLRHDDPRLGRIAILRGGADLMTSLARSRHLGAAELAVLLDVLADRLLRARACPFGPGADDQLALATMAVLRRDAVGWEAWDRWVQRLGPAVGPADVAADVAACLRALHLHLVLEPGATAVRGDLILALHPLLRRAYPGT